MVREARPIYFDMPSDAAADPRGIARVEDIIGATLPEDFKWFLKEFGGGIFALVEIFSADPASRSYILRHQPDVRSVVAFSPDGFGNHFAFRIVGDACLESIVLFDHLSRTPKPTDYPTFLDFVSRAGLPN